METEIIDPESPQPSGYTITKFTESKSEAPQASTVSIASENEDQCVTEGFDTTVSVESDSDQGNLLKGIENCSGAALKAVRLLLKQDFLTDFLYFNLYKF